MIDVLGDYHVDAPGVPHRLGDLFRATRASDGETVEVLTLAGALSSNRAFMRRFELTSSRAVALPEGVPGLVRVLDAGVTGEIAFVVREVVESRSASELLRSAPDGHVPLQLLRLIVHGVGAPLNFLHERDIIHGNLTTDAIRLLPGGKVALTDLGLPALTLQEAALLKARAPQALPFMAAEQMVGTEVDARTDVYALGVAAYVLGSGRYPRALAQLKSGPREYWRIAPPTLDEISPHVGATLSASVHKALHVAPERRFANVAEFVRAIGQRGATDVQPASSAVERYEPGQPPPGIGRGSDTMAVFIRPERVEVAPGNTAVLQLTITNQSGEAENYTVRIDGVPRQWISIPQEFVRLAPGATAEVAISIQAPREAASTANAYDVTIEVSATGGRRESQALAAELVVSGFKELVVEMDPQEVRQSQPLTLTVHNRGNETTVIRISGEDESEKLRFAMETPQMTLRAGQVATTVVRISPRQRPIVGRPHIHPFVIAVSTEGSVDERMPGQVMILPVIPTWIASIILLGLVALCGGLAVMVLPQLSGAPTETALATPTAAVIASTATMEATASLVADVATSTASSDAATAPVTSDAEAPTVRSTTDSPPDATVAPGASPAATQDGEPDVLVTATPALAPSMTPDAEATLAAEIPPIDEIAVEVQMEGGTGIWAVARDGSGQRLLIEEAMEPLWSPDGRRLAFVQRAVLESGEGQQIYVMTAAGTQLSPVGEPATRIGGLSWSSDGSLIAYHAVPLEATSEDATQIFVANSDGLSVRGLTEFEEGVSHAWPVWSPTDARLVTYASAIDGGVSQLRVLDSEGGVFAVLEAPDLVFLPGEYDWSPDGSQIALSAIAENGPPGLYVVDPLAPEEGLAAGGITDARWPDWSPAGDQILYLSGFGSDDAAVTIVDPGTGDTQIAAGGIPIERAFWSPTGSEIGIIADFNSDSILQLFVYAADGTGLAPLVNDAAQLTGGDPGTATVTGASWRPVLPE